MNQSIEVEESLAANPANSGEGELLTLHNGSHSINLRLWSVDDARAVLVISHGLGEHSGRYAHVADFFNRQGISVYAPDHRGHGLSAGKRGHVDHFADYSTDLRLVMESARGDNPGLPIHLFGHSLGAVIAVGYCLRHPSPQTLMLSSPSFAPAQEPPFLKVMLGKILARLNPRFTLSAELDASAISRDAAVVSAYQADPLVHGVVSGGWYLAYLEEKAFIEEGIAKLTPPLLMLVAMREALANPQVALQRFEAVTAEKKCVQYPEAFHEILNEPEEKIQAMNEMLAWLQAH